MNTHLWPNCVFTASGCTAEHFRHIKWLFPRNMLPFLHFQEFLAINGYDNKSQNQMMFSDDEFYDVILSYLFKIVLTHFLLTLHDYNIKRFMFECMTLNNFIACLQSWREVSVAGKRGFSISFSVLRRGRLVLERLVVTLGQFSALDLLHVDSHFEIWALVELHGLSLKVLHFMVH